MYTSVGQPIKQFEDAEIDMHICISAFVFLFQSDCDKQKQITTA